MIGCILFIYRGHPEDSSEIDFGPPSKSVDDSVQAETDLDSSMDDQDSTIMVDVKGAVQQPGVYEVEHTSRVFDIIELAEGFTKKAAQNEINLAARVQDEMLIYVPEEGELEQIQEIQANQDENSSIVKVNQATLEELETLNGVGPSKAQAILDYIEENGMFTDVDELLDVSGIGEKTLEKFKDDIIIP